jgi:proteic killer suppression protein
VIERLKLPILRKGASAVDLEAVLHLTNSVGSHAGQSEPRPLGSARAQLDSSKIPYGRGSVEPGSLLSPTGTPKACTQEIADTLDSSHYLTRASLHDTLLVEMISGFRCRDTERLWMQGHSRRWANIARVALKKLALLDAADRLEDLRVPPGNRLEQLKGQRTGQHSIRINDQWRLCFRWQTGNAHDVEIVDYH